MFEELDKNPYLAYGIVVGILLLKLAFWLLFALWRIIFLIILTDKCSNYTLSDDLIEKKYFRRILNCHIGRQQLFEESVRIMKRWMRENVALELIEKYEEKRNQEIFLEIQALQEANKYQFM